ncbi:hypothetical protein PILCRDRAFT_7731 [Piloderma croceum F 1598]|uniref:Uncharacterized protein n=1 Tax=Piloderma croceum (strain F 1598) TaxID=765440 RepID=A0A0C3FWA3_PILCF|nr:hypothetical protein PILCRDRAFT_7731 [Piloderma croceum F 1598]
MLIVSLPLLPLSVMYVLEVRTRILSQLNLTLIVSLLLLPLRLLYALYVRARIFSQLDLTLIVSSPLLPLSKLYALYVRARILSQLNLTLIVSSPLLPLRLYVLVFYALIEPAAETYTDIRLTSGPSQMSVHGLVYIIASFSVIAAEPHADRLFATASSQMVRVRISMLLNLALEVLLLLLPLRSYAHVPIATEPSADCVSAYSSPSGYCTLPYLITAEPSADFVSVTAFT